MNKAFHKSRCFLTALALFLILVSARTSCAAVRELKDGDLKNVKKAEAVEGSWAKTKYGVRFLPAEGRIIRNQWIKVNGHIYYLDYRGCRVTGWVKYRNKQYSLKNNGALRTGWYKKRYLLKSTGAMAKKLRTVDGKQYYFGNNGKYISGWKKTGGEWYFFQQDGGKAFGWYHAGNGSYYLDPDKNGARTTGWITIKKKTYYFDSNGILQKDTWIDSRYVNKKGVYDPTVKGPVIYADKPMVALTFDDGPGPYTERLLDCLERNHARATFFMVGSNVAIHASTVKRMKDLNCELGNHSWSHSQLSRLSDAGINGEISGTSNAIANAAGQKPTVCRLPYGDGHNNSRVLNAVGLPSIYWSIDTRDWANTGNSQHTVDAVLNNVRSGDIVLMHDIHKASVDAAERIIPELIRRGYQLVTVSELAKYKGKTTLQTGRTYYSFR